jgi:hypothetical protein
LDLLVLRVFLDQQKILELLVKLVLLDILVLRVFLDQQKILELLVKLVLLVL